MHHFSISRALCSSSSSQRSERSASINVEDVEYADLHHPPYRRMTKSYSGLPTPVAVYNGPFIGRARALVDYIPSPYDRDALRFSVSRDNAVDFEGGLIFKIEKNVDEGIMFRKYAD